MRSLPEGFRALVLGATGAFGSAFGRKLSEMQGCAVVIGLARRSDPGFDLEDEASIAACARAVAPRGPFDLIIDATGARTRISLSEITQPASFDRTLFRLEDVLPNRRRP